MKIITRGEAMRIHQQHPTSRLFPFCTGKYRWHGSAEAYTGREVQDIPGVLAVFAERRKDSFGPYVHSPIFCEDFIVSDTLSGTTHPDDNDDHPWWGLPCTVTPCFGARLVQEGNRLHYLADRAGIRGRFRDADAYPLDQAFPLLMKQLKLMLTSGELNPRHQHTVTLYAKGLTCEADTLGSCGYVYLAVYPTPETKK
ncbi:hypothetical protein DIV13_26630 [Escherichia coli]|nr:hypothetical protein DIV13_26630 [Escherichia coli]